MIDVSWVEPGMKVEAAFRTKDAEVNIVGTINELPSKTDGTSLYVGGWCVRTPQGTAPKPLKFIDRVCEDEPTPKFKWVEDNGLIGHWEIDDAPS